MCSTTPALRCISSGVSAFEGTFDGASEGDFEGPFEGALAGDDKAVFGKLRV